DEPSLGLSPKLVDEVLRQIPMIVQRGTSVLLAEQNVAKALKYCDRAYVIEVGRVAISGQAEELRRSDIVRRAYLGGEPRKGSKLMDDKEIMRRVVELSRQGMAEGFGYPFGCVIVKDGEIVGEGHNEVLATNDPTAHAEILAIRRASAKLQTYDLKGCE